MSHEKRTYYTQTKYIAVNENQNAQSKYSDYGFAGGQHSQKLQFFSTMRTFSIKFT